MRLRPALLVLPLVGLAACGSGDDGSATTASTVAPEASDVVTATTEAVEPADTTAPDLAPQECQDVPDGGEFVEGEVPPAIPACTAPEDLVIHQLRPGSGREAAEGDTLVVDYLGMIIGSGEVFDASYTRDVPLDFPLGRGGVIAGWDQGLVGVATGSLVRLDIPTELAYGDSPPGDQIQPGDALSFYVEVRAVVPSTTKEDAPLDLDIPPSVDAVGLTIDDVTVGDGPVVEAGDTAVVHMLLVRGDNEVVLYNSWERDDALQIILEEGQSLPGVIEGLEGAHVGTVRVLTMPPELAFGVDGQPSLGLPRETDLIVVLEVFGVY